jgi:hypothetical protein
MILTPWKHLRRGYTEAENTLLLDYVSRNIFVALFSAWEHGHWAVAAAISGSQILRLVGSNSPSSGWPHTYAVTCRPFFLPDSLP